MDSLQNEKDGEDNPASKQEPPSLIIGRDHEDHWIVVEAHGLCGGIFANEEAARRYAREASRGRPDAIRAAPTASALNIYAVADRRPLARR